MYKVFLLFYKTWKNLNEYALPNFTILEFPSYSLGDFLDWKLDFTWVSFRCYLKYWSFWTMINIVISSIQLGESTARKSRTNAYWCVGQKFRVRCKICNYFCLSHYIFYGSEIPSIICKICNNFCLFHYMRSSEHGKQ